MKAANSSETDKVVEIPAGAVISLMPCYFKQLTGVELRIEGTLLQTLNFASYPYGNNGFDQFDALLHFEGSHHITVAGNGTIDGQGYMFWVREILGKNGHDRPYILEFQRSTHLELYGLMVKNSPYYHIVPNDCAHIYMHDFEIYVDVWGQMELHNLFGNKYDKELEDVNGWKIELPIFPLNTDGIDIFAYNATFRNIKITNFDDGIVPKPCNRSYEICTCAQDILVEDIETTFSIGMTIGSVPPATTHACIKNVLFRNVKMDRPIKGIYLKSNPGDVGDGEIRNITYENFVMDEPVWWAIYIGPQQQV
jgi:polygalacturonase